MRDVKKSFARKSFLLFVEKPSEDVSLAGLARVPRHVSFGRRLCRTFAAGRRARRDATAPLRGPHAAAGGPSPPRASLGEGAAARQACRESRAASFPLWVSSPLLSCIPAHPRRSFQVGAPRRQGPRPRRCRPARPASSRAVRGPPATVTRVCCSGFAKSHRSPRSPPQRWPLVAGARGLLCEVAVIFCLHGR